MQLAFPGATGSGQGAGWLRTDGRGPRGHTAYRQAVQGGRPRNGPHLQVRGLPTSQPPGSAKQLPEGRERTGKGASGSGRSRRAAESELAIPGGLSGSGDDEDGGEKLAVLPNRGVPAENAR